VAGLGAGLIYRVSPFFWRQYFKEFGRDVSPAPQQPDPARWPDRGVHMAWIGHSTVLMKIDGFTILTDPVFSTRIGLGLGPLTLGLKRMVRPALELERMPRADLILLSHAHLDHFDLPSLRALENRHTAVVTAARTSDLLRAERYLRVYEMGWEDELQVGPARLRGLEVNHWGARMRSDTWRGYNGYLIRVGRWRILFAGDTAITDAFERVGGAEVALMPIGAYNPWIRVHCTPEQAWRMANQARAEHVLPLHHRTFNLSQEPSGEPLERMLTAAGAEEKRVALRMIGEEFRLT
jgi:L-ascorbate metabolism protein UlaG (beta-lactamase superfamily)